MARREKPIVGSGLHTSFFIVGTKGLITPTSLPQEKQILKHDYVYLILTLKLILIGQEKIIGKETRILLILLCTLYTHKHFGL